MDTFHLPFAVVFILLLLSAAPALAQSPENNLRELESDYERRNFAMVELNARRMLAEYERYSPTQLVRVHTLLGIITYSQNELPASRAHFSAALSLNPELTLDPRLVSPKIRSFLEEVRGEYRSGAAASGETIRYLVLHDPRPSAAWRAMILPGWGHLRLGEITRGYVLIGLWTGSIGAAWLAHNLRDRRVTGSVQWSHVRDGLLISAAALWLYSYIDVVHLWEPHPARLGLVHGFHPMRGGVTFIAFSIRL